MKKILIIIFSLIPFASCQKQIIERHSDGTLSLILENSPVVDVMTKAEGTAVSVDDFDVSVCSEETKFSYVYKDMPAVITVPVGLYYVSAENLTEAESLTTLDIWGQIRYAGKTESKEVTAGQNPTKFSLTCKMTNTALSVIFDESIAKHFTGYSLTAYTTDTRKLVYNAENTAGEKPAVGYFSPDSALNYEFAGTFDGKPVTVTGSRTLVPASHLHLTFKMSTQNGVVLRPDIIVDTTCEELYETVTVDPSAGVSK